MWTKILCIYIGMIFVDTLKALCFIMQTKIAAGTQVNYLCALSGALMDDGVVYQYPSIILTGQMNRNDIRAQQVKFH